MPPIVCTDIFYLPKYVSDDPKINQLHENSSRPIGDRLLALPILTPLARTTLSTTIVLPRAIPKPPRNIISPRSAHPIVISTTTIILILGIPGTVLSVRQPRLINAPLTLPPVHPAAPLLSRPLSAATKVQPVREDVRAGLL